MKLHSELREDEGEIVFTRTKEEYKSPINSFWDGRVHFWILVIYGAISALFVTYGDSLVGWLILGTVLTCNLVWFVFKGWRLFVKWFFGLVSVMLIFTSCEQQKEPAKEDLVKSEYVQDDYSIVTIDGCEYIEFDQGYGQYRVYSMIHKGNCKNEIHKYVYFFD